ncbi:5-(carboxyamino)imidazole ribonucleotide synthase, partial [Thermodesulfovibrionales bacterium]|nr:5-(carboxyamino)imidazole ribonucleotide synthase [Thermodesulfovibrionales bacterium]
EKIEMNNNRFHFPSIKIGIVGGGQLGKMMVHKARKMGFYVTVLDPTPDCPAAQAGAEQIVGSFYDEDRLRELVEHSDVTTYDIEHTDTKVLQGLAEEGNKIYPSPVLLETIQDKLRQKDMLNKGSIPTARHEKVDRFDTSCLGKFGFPVVQKAQKGGYDGRGVVVIKNGDNLESIIRSESFIEEFIDFEKELAIMVARGIDGEIRCYPVTEMFFDERANICDMVVAPARIEKEIEEEARRVAIRCVEVLDGVGIFGIEMFLTRDKRVLVSEIAPRPHNSGHYTIEACLTCQFEQHIRAITGLPLGSTRLLCPAVMVNLLGEEGHHGHPAIEGLAKALSVEGLSFYFYGKKTTLPFKKMGHITILDENLGRVIEKAKEVKDFLRVKAEVNA